MASSIGSLASSLDNKKLLPAGRGRGWVGSGVSNLLLADEEPKPFTRQDVSTWLVHVSARCGNAGVGVGGDDCLGPTNHGLSFPVTSSLCARGEQ